MESAPHLNQISAALQYTNQDLLTIQEKRYTLTVLGIVKEHHDYRSSGIRPSSHKFREIDFRHFAVVAALSERIHHLEPWVKDHLCDDALYTKLRRGREIFYCNDPDHSVRHSLPHFSLAHTTSPLGLYWA